ncbi:MAG: hypothetical protein O3A55_05815 [Bacteroidetes bacterium]|nr:hypothetical protein [Bacteroidota bacterium]
MKILLLLALIFVTYVVSILYLPLEYLIFSSVFILVGLHFLNKMILKHQNSTKQKNTNTLTFFKKLFNKSEEVEVQD